MPPCVPGCWLQSGDVNEPPKTPASNLSMAKEPLDPSALRPARSPKQRMVVHPDRMAAEAQVAQEIADLIRDEPRTVLGVATGGTMEGVYRELASRAKDLDLSQLVAFSLDEFLGIDESHRLSFRSFLNHHFIAPLGLRADQLVTPDAQLAAVHPKSAAERFEDAIAEAGGVDLQLLGIGRNGHVAFNEPGSLVASRTRVIELDDVTRADAAAAFGSLDAVPTHAITVGIATIMESKRLRLLAFGEGKARAVARTAAGPVGGDVPATFLSTHQDLELHLDRSAAGLP